MKNYFIDQHKKTSLSLILLVFFGIFATFAQTRNPTPSSYNPYGTYTNGLLEYLRMGTGYQNEILIDAPMYDGRGLQIATARKGLLGDDVNGSSLGGYNAAAMIDININGTLEKAVLCWNIITTNPYGRRTGFVLTKDLKYKTTIEERMAICKTNLANVRPNDYNLTTTYYTIKNTTSPWTDNTYVYPNQTGAENKVKYYYVNNGVINLLVDLPYTPNVGGEIKGKAIDLASPGRSFRRVTSVSSVARDVYEQGTTNVIGEVRFVYGFVYTDTNERVYCWVNYDCLELPIIPVTGVTMTPATVTVSVDNTQQLTATVAPSDATNQAVSWTTSNAAIATVSASGLVTGVAFGTATITATTQDGGKIATSAITVTQLVATTLNPVGDADIYQGSSTTNYGTNTILRAKNTSGSSVTRKTYVKFDLTSANLTNIQSAKVRLYCSALDGTYSVTAYQQATDTWTETALTWGNAPAIGTAIGAQSINATAKYFEWDVTSYVQSQNSGDKVVSLCFADAATAGLMATFESKEGTNKPQLVITDLKNAKIASTKSLKAEKNSELMVKVYPNPLNQDVLTLKLEGYENLDKPEVFIYNLLGQEVYQSKIPDNKTLKINTSGLKKSSTYIVSVRSGNSILNTKLIVN